MTFPVQAVLAEVRKRVVGQDLMVERLLIGLLTGGHVLLEGVPGLAKTLTVRTLADVIHHQDPFRVAHFVRELTEVRLRHER